MQISYAYHYGNFQKSNHTNQRFSFASHCTEVKPTYVIVDYKGKVQNMTPFGVTDPCFSWLPFLADLIPQLIPGQTIWYQICGRFLIGKEVEKNIFQKHKSMSWNCTSKICYKWSFFLFWWENENLIISPSAISKLYGWWGYPSSSIPILTNSAKLE